MKRLGRPSRRVEFLARLDERLREVGAWTTTTRCHCAGGDFVVRQVADVEEAAERLGRSLVASSTGEWPLSVASCSATPEGHLRVRLDRAKAARDVVADVLARDDVKEGKDDGAIVMTTVRLHGSNDEAEEEGADEDLSRSRARILADTVRRLIKLRSPCVNPEKIPIEIVISTESAPKGSNIHRIFCAPTLVRDAKEERLKMTYGQYLEKRVVDMKLKAQHRYRVIVTDPDQWNRSLLRLGRSCVTIDLMENKVSIPVRLATNDGGCGKSRGASFLLYNSARLSSIIGTFEEKVAKKVYPPLPKIDDVDFSVLNDEEEWNMIFDYMMDFPSVFESALVVDSKTCIVAPYKLCTYLNSLIAKFSVYYRRVRVLLEPREHLLPKVFARIYLLMAIREIISKVLSVFDIEILSEM